MIRPSSNSNRHMEADTQTSDNAYAAKSVMGNSTQTEDTQYFTTFYDHIQAQHQELLEAKMDFEHHILNFDRNVSNLGNYMNYNFRGLAGQLHFQLDAFIH